MLTWVFSLMQAPKSLLKSNKKMLQPIFISTVISAISVVAVRKLTRQEAKMQKVLQRRRLDPS
ncbi:MAG TPA: hypothetical protein DF712_03435 [Balneola sp.]|nr:hypothetical protein [Balneola sp.]